MLIATVISFCSLWSHWPILWILATGNLLWWLPQSLSLLPSWLAVFYSVGCFYLWQFFFSPWSPGLTTQASPAESFPVFGSCYRRWCHLPDRSGQSQNRPYRHTHRCGQLHFGQKSRHPQQRYGWKDLSDGDSVMGTIIYVTKDDTTTAPVLLVVMPGSSVDIAYDGNMYFTDDRFSVHSLKLSVWPSLCTPMSRIKSSLVLPICRPAGKLTQKSTVGGLLLPGYIRQMLSNRKVWLVLKTSSFLQFRNPAPSPPKVTRLSTVSSGSPLTPATSSTFRSVPMTLRPSSMAGKEPTGFGKVISPRAKLAFRNACFKLLSKKLSSGTKSKVAKMWLSCLAAPSPRWQLTFELQDGRWYRHLANQPHWLDM